MSETATSPLELWNLSRRLAASAYRIVDGDEEFTDITQAHPEWPFASEAELSTLVENIDGESRSEVIDSLQRIIHERLKPTMMGSIDGSAYDNREVIHEWNAARSAATSLLGWSGSADMEYSTIRDEHEGVVPETATAAESLIASIEGETYNDRHMALTRTLNDGRSGEMKDGKAGGSSGGDGFGLAVEIAEDLACVFIDRGDTDYRRVMESYGDVVFPARDVAMMEVMNASGSTRDARVEAIAEWVETWCDDPEAARELNSLRPSRMGMGGRGR